ncbi:hypothetical protein LTR04_003728 [Oleoguttula sp. CCFEE 6159]|nr:hypothetical protein LTR04_003728 [Oleoguttula sp. CCFEE 6159]
MTDCDNLLRRFVDPETQQRFFQDPDGVAGLYQFTSKTSHHVYVAIDPTKTPELEQRGVVVLVTGAGRGIGRVSLPYRETSSMIDMAKEYAVDASAHNEQEVAVYFAKAKAKAVIICARTLSRLEETGTEMYKVNPETEVLMQQVDVTSEKDVKSLFDAANDRYGTVRVAVSNAGRNGEPKLLADSDTESWWNDYETNVKGLYLIAKYFIKNLGEKTGTLVNMSSTNSLSVIPTQSAYGSSKNAANRLIEQLHWGKFSPSTR